MEDPIEKANHRISELRKEITAKLRTVKELEQRNSQLQQTVDDRDKQLKSLHEAAALEEKKRKEEEEERWAEYQSMMAKVRDEQKAMEDARVKLEAARAKQQREIAESRQLVEQWQQAVDNVRRENEQLKQTNISQLHDYQQRYIALQEQQARAKSQYASSLFTAQQQQQQQADSIHALEDSLGKQAIAMKQLEQQIIAERADAQQQYRLYRERVEELSRRQEEKVKELTSEYLLLTAETESIVSGIKQEIDFRGEKVSTLQQWEQSRERIEDENKTLKSNISRLRKEAEAERRERQRQDREQQAELKALRDSVTLLQSDKELLQKELNTKKAALKVYKDEFEQKQKQRIEQEEKEKARQAAERDRGAKGGLTGGLLSLFGGKRKEEADSNGLLFGGKTVHPSAVHSAADKGFLDLEEEMAVALTERVEKLSEEKGRLEDDMLLLQRQLEQEKIIAAQLRQQLKQEGRLDAAASSSALASSSSSASSTDAAAAKAQQKKDKLVLSPENTARVLTETIARNRELEEAKKEQDRELRRLKQQLDVKRQELKEALRLAGKHQASLSSTQAGGTVVKSRSNSSLSNNTGGGSTRDLKAAQSPRSADSADNGTAAQTATTAATTAQTAATATAAAAGAGGGGGEGGAGGRTAADGK